MKVSFIELLRSDKSHIMLMDPSSYLQKKSFSPCPSLPLGHFLSSPFVPLLSHLISASIHRFNLWTSLSFSPLLPQYPRCPFSPWLSLRLILIFAFSVLSHAFPALPFCTYSPHSRFSASHSPSEAQKDVTEEDIPGVRRHQYCQSSATPWGPLELVSDWNTPTHMQTLSLTLYNLCLSVSPCGANYNETKSFFPYKVKLMEGPPYFNTEMWRVCVSMHFQKGRGTNYKSRGIVDFDSSVFCSHTLLIVKVCS